MGLARRSRRETEVRRLGGCRVQHRNMRAFLPLARGLRRNSLFRRGHTRHMLRACFGRVAARGLRIEHKRWVVAALRVQERGEEGSERRRLRTGPGYSPRRFVVGAKNLWRDTEWHQQTSKLLCADVIPALVLCPWAV